ncbi:MAG: FAD-dependent oxidoreductase [Labilithrix sp.]|nr:FAD-dependent oxidoreductase [Labilithrix sp.]
MLGSGIAGLSLAEILSRNGWQITIVDTSTDIGGDASRCTQNWLHTGWLYAGLPCPSAMVGCSTSLRLFQRTYERVLPRDVVNVEADNRGITYPKSAAGWFSSERMHYLFATSTYDLTPAQKETWSSFLDDVVLKRLSRLGYPTNELAELPEGLAALMRSWEGDPSGESKYRVIPSTDARIDTRRVLSSLLKLLGENTQVIAGARYEVVPVGDRTGIRIDGELHVPDLCVMAAGKAIPQLLSKLGAQEIAKSFQSVCSPVVVLERALDLPNFIRFTPNLPETINHVRYSVSSGDVSTVGSYDFHPADQRPDIRPFVEKVCGRLGVSTSTVVGSYYGTKTELVGKQERRYNHALEPVNANTYYAIAGKFSQFPLLVHELSQKLGLRIDIANESRGTLAMDVAETAPELLVRAAAAKRHAA